MSKKGKGRQFV